MPVPFIPKFVDLVRTASTTTGTGPLVPGAGSLGFASFAQSCVAGDQFYYCVQGVDNPAEREVGRGTLQANGAITREPMSGTPVNFTPGSKTIALVTAAEWFRKIDAQASATMAVGIARATISSVTDLDGRALLAGEAYYFALPLGYLGVSVLLTGIGGSTAVLSYFGKIGYPIGESGVARTAALADAGCFVRFGSASPSIFTVPPNSSAAFPRGTEIDGIQAGAGALTIAAGAGVTLNASGTDLTLAGQFSSFTAKKVATNEWDVVGKF